MSMTKPKITEAALWALHAINAGHSDIRALGAAMRLNPANRIAPGRVRRNNAFSMGNAIAKRLKAAGLVEIKTMANGVTHDPMAKLTAAGLQILTTTPSPPQAGDLQPR